MGLFDNLSSALGGATGGKQNDLLETVMNLVGGGGGLQGLVQQFAGKGLGDVINSWIGTGQNMPISANQIQEVLGSDTIKGIASKLGLNADDLSGQLSNLMPQVVDKLTPDGKIPEGDLLGKGLDFLKGNIFGGK